MLCSVIKSFSLEEELYAGTETIRIGRVSIVPSGNAANCSVTYIIHFVSQHYLSVVAIKEVINAKIMLVDFIH